MTFAVASVGGCGWVVSWVGWGGWVSSVLLVCSGSKCFATHPMLARPPSMTGTRCQQTAQPGRTVRSGNHQPPEPSALEPPVLRTQRSRPTRRQNHRFWHAPLPEPYFLETASRQNRPFWRHLPPKPVLEPRATRTDGSGAQPESCWKGAAGTSPLKEK